MDTTPCTMPWGESSFLGLRLFSPDPSPFNTYACSCSSQTRSLAHSHGRHRRQRLPAIARRKSSCWQEFRQGKGLLYGGKADATWNKDHRSKVPDPSPMNLSYGIWQRFLQCLQQKVWLLQIFPVTTSILIPSWGQQSFKENLNETGWWLQDLPMRLFSI